VQGNLRRGFCSGEFDKKFYSKDFVKGIFTEVLDVLIVFCAWDFETTLISESRFA